jgi:hypothetical protein
MENGKSTMENGKLSSTNDLPFSILDFHFPFLLTTVAVDYRVA